MIEPLPVGLTLQAEQILFRIYRSPHATEQTRLRARDLIWLRSMRAMAKQIHQMSFISSQVRRHADDLFSDCVLKLPVAIDQFNPQCGARFLTYYHWIVKNCVSRRLRHYLFMVSPPEGRDTLASVGIGDWDSATVSDHVREADDRDAVGQLIRSLPARDLRVIRLLYGLDGGGDHTKTEVASIEGVSREYVGQLESRALRRMTASAAAMRVGA